MLFAAAAFVGLTRMELALSPAVLPLVMPGRRFLRPTPRTTAAWAALLGGVVLAGAVALRRNPMGQVALFGPRSVGEVLSGLYVQPPPRVNLPPLFGQPLISLAVGAFLVWIWRRRSLALLALPVAARCTSRTTGSISRSASWSPDAR